MGSRRWGALGVGRAGVREPDSGARGRPLVAAAGKPDRGRGLGREPAIPGEGVRAGPEGAVGADPVQAEDGAGSGQWAAGRRRRPCPGVRAPGRHAPRGRQAPLASLRSSPPTCSLAASFRGGPLLRSRRETEARRGQPPALTAGPRLRDLRTSRGCPAWRRSGLKGRAGPLSSHQENFKAGGLRSRVPTPTKPALPAGGRTPGLLGRMLPGAQVCENLSLKCKTSSGATG